MNLAEALLNMPSNIGFTECNVPSFSFMQKANDWTEEKKAMLEIKHIEEAEALANGFSPEPFESESTQAESFREEIKSDLDLVPSIFGWS